MQAAPLSRRSAIQQAGTCADSMQSQPTLSHSHPAVFAIQPLPFQPDKPDLLGTASGLNGRLRLTSFSADTHSLTQANLE